MPRMLAETPKNSYEWDPREDRFDSRNYTSRTQGRKEKA
jgi:hypothetical protein